ncbi:hypothetical protein [Bacillus sp. TV3D]|uniref:hypothetical protein n=1 Tax=Bacillus sp. TV3D TaxID=3447562 RepID=UPI003ED8F60C
MAKIGGFRPDPAAHSWFAGHFFIHPDHGWPADQDDVMIPILQIYLPEVPGGMNGCNECKMIQIFLNQKALPIDTPKTAKAGSLLNTQLWKD